MNSSKKPRIFVLAAVGVLIFILYLASQPSNSLASWQHPGGRLGLQNDNLAARLAFSEEIFQRSLIKRKDLIQRFGPSADKIKAYPTNYEAYTLWDFFTPSFQCPFAVERIGVSGDGGKYVCGLQRIANKPNCVVYSFGINGESSFEAELLERTSGCQIWGYDFSVDAFGPEVAKNKKIAHRAHFKPLGLSGRSNPAARIPMYTLPDLMKQNGHDFIDVLKIDIETHEFDALGELVKVYAGKPLPFGQLQLEIHGWRSHWQDKFPQFLEWWGNLEKAGLRAFWTEPNLVYANVNPGAPPELAEYSFINIFGHHELVEEPAPPKTSVA